MRESCPSSKMINTIQLHVQKGQGEEEGGGGRDREGERQEREMKKEGYRCCIFSQAHKLGGLHRCIDSV